jgi:hypothetical protein
MEPQRLERRIQAWLIFFMLAIALSGLTAFPLEWETGCLQEIVTSPHLALDAHAPALVAWIVRVHTAVAENGERYPFMAYGTDWLAFAHLVIALAFWGPLRDPVRNAWVVDWAMLACVGVLPLALICGAVRGIPPFWTAVDMSFGVFGLIPLAIVRRLIRTLERRRLQSSVP